MGHRARNLLVAVQLIIVMSMIAILALVF